MSLILGAVQFGVEYGITNQSGKPSQDIAFETLDAAWNVGIRVLDSAQAYGSANQVIIDYHAAQEKRFSVINKIMRNRESGEQALSSLLRERDLMNIDTFDCVMFHYASSVPHELPETFLESLKKSGLSKRVGISIEIPKDYEILSQRFDFDVVQLPLNLLNQHFMDDEFLKKIKSKGVEIHARSAFSQGLLINDLSNIPDYLQSLKPLIFKFQNDCLQLGISPVAGSLLFLMQKPEIDHIVVGAQNAVQLRDILRSYQIALDLAQQGKNLEWQDYACDNYDLVHPLHWIELKKRVEAI